MDFRTEAPVDAPPARVFDALTDFDAMERRLGGGGLHIARVTDGGADLVGTAWRADFTLRGAKRTAEVTLVEAHRPDRLVFEAESGGLQVTTTLALAALDADRTLLGVVAVLAPRTMSARLFLQPMKLAKGRLDSGFAKRVAGYARDIGRRLNG